MAQYEILIKTEISDEDNKNIASDNKKTKEKDSISKTQTSVEHAIDYMITTTAKSIVTSVVPELVRDTRVSDRINFAMNMVQTAQAFAINPVFGAAQLTMQIAGDILGYALNQRRENLRGEVMWQRAGYINRSR